jgi:hypothetical protein
MDRQQAKNLRFGFPVCWTENGRLERGYFVRLEKDDSAKIEPASCDTVIFVPLEQVSELTPGTSTV